MENRELLAHRITEVLTMLNSGETLDMNELAEAFKVSKRTIQRDINTRLAFLPIKKNGSKLSLSPSALGRLTNKDIVNFAQLSGVKDLFPNLDHHFITSLLSNAFNSPFMVMGNNFEHERDIIRKNLTKIEQAVASRKTLAFNYKGKQYKYIRPYKLINSNQVWYLAAEDKEKLKTFHLAGLEAVFILDVTFEHNSELLKRIEQSESIYIAQTSEKLEVVLQISAEVAHYFRRRDLLPEQQIDKEMENGGLIVSCKVSYDLQIVPIIKYWMPHIQVISPQEIQDQVKQDIESYLSSNNNN